MRESEASNASYVVGCNAELAARVIISTGRSLLTDGAATRRGYLISSMKSENGGALARARLEENVARGSDRVLRIQSLFLQFLRNLRDCWKLLAVIL